MSANETHPISTLHFGTSQAIIGSGSYPTGNFGNAVKMKCRRGPTAAKAIQEFFQTP